VAFVVIEKFGRFGSKEVETWEFCITVLHGQSLRTLPKLWGGQFKKFLG
jgi:hypothetical protein